MKPLVCDECGTLLLDGGVDWYCPSDAPHPKHEERVRQMIASTATMLVRDHDAAIASLRSQVDSLQERLGEVQKQVARLLPVVEILAECEPKEHDDAEIIEMARAALPSLEPIAQDRGSV